MTAVITDEALSALLARHAPLRPTALVPELRAFTADDELPLWLALEEALGARIDAPFFAVAWPGAQALARCVLDGVVDVRGRRVVDIGCGSGLAAVAAAKASAAAVLAVDRDPLALSTTRLLAQAHGVVVDTRCAADFEEGQADVVLAGDVVYNAGVAASFARALGRWRKRGRSLLIADSGRPFFDPAGLDLVMEFADVPVPRAVEGVQARTVRVYR